MNLHRFAVPLGVVLTLVSVAPASATTITFNAYLSGPAESPPTASLGTGYALVTYDDVAHTLAVDVTFSGLTGTTTASHIHAATPAPFTGTAGVATTTPTFAGFPLGVTSGHYVNVLDLTLATSYNPSFVTASGGTTAAAEFALVSAIAQERSYLNIHSNVNPGGEIRGFLVPVPEPGTLALVGVGVLALRRRRK
jgi:hypothetical protein